MTTRSTPSQKSSFDAVRRTTASISRSTRSTRSTSTHTSTSLTGTSSQGGEGQSTLGTNATHSGASNALEATAPLATFTLNIGSSGGQVSSASQTSPPRRLTTLTSSPLSSPTNLWNWVTSYLHAGGTSSISDLGRSSTERGSITIPEGSATASSRGWSLSTSPWGLRTSNEDGLTSTENDEGATSSSDYASNSLSTTKWLPTSFSLTDSSRDGSNPPSVTTGSFEGITMRYSTWSASSQYPGAESAIWTNLDSTSAQSTLTGNNGGPTSTSSSESSIISSMEALSTSMSVAIGSPGTRNSQTFSGGNSSSTGLSSLDTPILPGISVSDSESGNSSPTIGGGADSSTTAATPTNNIWWTALFTGMHLNLTAPTAAISAATSSLPIITALQSTGGDVAADFTTFLSTELFILAWTVPRETTIKQDGGGAIPTTTHFISREISTRIWTITTLISIGVETDIPAAPNQPPATIKLSSGTGSVK